ncbi:MULTISPECIES: hypothetical protein [unclassified Actinotalea]|uniref:hypothetical protein n=1 Tax=unclassified Actinotalea TaxID=2638618 RepID=UPI0015F5784B|nr:MULTISPECIES: hypothetical protein [unclassified Actinotalea]
MERHTRPGSGGSREGADERARGRYAGADGARVEVGDGGRCRALAHDAANQVDLHDGAFGLLCAFLPGFVNTAEVETGRAIGAARDTLEAMVDGVVAMAEDYRAADDGVRGRMDTIAGVLP